MGVVQAWPTINRDVEFKALHVLRGGDASARLPVDWPESAADAAIEFNEPAAWFGRMNREMRAIGRDSAPRLGAEFVIHLPEAGIGSAEMPRNPPRAPVSATAW